MNEPDKKWLREAFKIAKEFSQDAETQTGALIIYRNKMISFGSNRLPKNNPHRYNGFGYKRIYFRPEKYNLLIHAEVDAITSAPLIPEGSTMYITWDPCDRCMEEIVKTGIERIVVPLSAREFYNKGQNPERLEFWNKKFAISQKIAKQNEISYETFDEPLGDVSIVFNGEIFRP